MIPALELWQRFPLLHSHSPPRLVYVGPWATRKMEQKLVMLWHHTCTYVWCNYVWWNLCNLVWRTYSHTLTHTPTHTHMHMHAHSTHTHTHSDHLHSSCKPCLSLSHPSLHHRQHRLIQLNSYQNIWESVLKLIFWVNQLWDFIFSGQFEKVW